MMLVRLKRCLCGCGFHVGKPGRKYINGHNRRGDICSIEHRERIGKANRGKKRTIEARKKMSNAAKARPSNFLGKKHTPETCEKIGVAGRGRKLSLETRAKMSRIRKGKQSPFYGKKHTLEAQAKISRASIQRWQNPEYCERRRHARAKQILPVKNTSIEVAIAKLLKTSNLDFVQHKTFKSFGFTVNGLGCPRLLGHQVDFALPKYKLIIECDGNYWHNYPHGTVKDFYLDRIVNANGWKVLRLWGSEIKENPDKCLDRILTASS